MCVCVCVCVCVWQGHNLTGYQLAVLQHRLAACKIPQWSRICRLRRKDMPKVILLAIPLSLSFSLFLVQPLGVYFWRECERIGSYRFFVGYYCEENIIPNKPNALFFLPPPPPPPPPPTLTLSPLTSPPVISPGAVGGVSNVCRPASL